MAAPEPYYFEPSILETPKIITVKIAKWIIAWKNIYSVGLGKDTRSGAGFSPRHQFRVERNDVT